jgi:GNAT superfamily N-acetyltransferase
MSEYTIRLLEGEDDYEFGVKLLNACFAERLDVDYDIIQIRDWWRVGDNPLRQVYIVDIADQPIAALRFTEFPSDHGQLLFYCNVNIMPDHYSTPLLHDLFTEMLERVTTHEPDELRMSLFEFLEDHLAVAEAHGFERIQRDQLSSLQLSKVNFDSLAKVVQRVNESGIRLVTLPEYKEENPHYKSAIVELHNTIYRDVPGFETSVMTEEKFETRVFQNQDLLPEAWVLALDDDQLVGMTYVTRFGNDEDCLTNLTGVIRSHRRRGITTAMKVVSFEILREMGFKRIMTGNEENNPMYEINLKFGFEPGPAAYMYSKRMTDK